MEIKELAKLLNIENLEIYAKSSPESSKVVKVSKGSLTFVKLNGQASKAVLVLDLDLAAQANLINEHMWD